MVVVVSLRWLVMNNESRMVVNEGVETASDEEQKERVTNNGNGVEDSRMNEDDEEGGVEGTEEEKESKKEHEPSCENVGQIESTNVQGGDGGVVFTPRFDGFIIGFVALFTVSVISLHPGGIAASIAVLLFLIAGFIEKPRHPENHLTVSHDITPLTPKPGDEIHVTTTIQNTSEQALTDVRIIDKVPKELEVGTGSPRGVCTLQPNEEVTLSYTITAKRGVFEFDGVRVRNRAVMGTMWVDNVIKPDTVQAVNCTIDPNETPLENQATQYIGQLLGDKGGDGVEFFKTREYHHGDSPSRINWRDLAKTGELSTITYREQQTAEITIVLDAREYAHTAETSSHPPASVLCSYTTYELTAGLTSDGHHVGVVIPGLTSEKQRGEGMASLPYEFIPHGSSLSQTRRAFNVIDRVEQLAEDSVSTATHNTGSEYNRQFDRETGTPITDTNQSTSSEQVFDQLNNVHVSDFTNALTSVTTSNTQYIILTPLLDKQMFELCKHIHATGTPVLIISPDITQPPPTTQANKTPRQTAEYISQRVLSVQRTARVESLRAHGITVIDWKSKDTLSNACKKQTRARGR